MQIEFTIPRWITNLGNRSSKAKLANTTSLNTESKNWFNKEILIFLIFLGIAGVVGFSLISPTVEQVNSIQNISSTFPATSTLFSAMPLVFGMSIILVGFYMIMRFIQGAGLAI